MEFVGVVVFVDVLDFLGDVFGFCALALEFIIKFDEQAGNVREQPQDCSREPKQNSYDKHPKGTDRRH